MRFAGIIIAAAMVLSSCAEPRRFAPDGSRDWCIEIGKDCP